MIRFQDAIPAVIRFATEEHLDDPIYVIRDVLGRVSIALDVSDKDLPTKAELSKKLNALLGAFAPGLEQGVQSRDDLLFPEEIFETRVQIAHKPAVYLVDRLSNNQDWLRSPLGLKPPLPTAVAFSIKGATVPVNVSPRAEICA